LKQLWINRTAVAMVSLPRPKLFQKRAKQKKENSSFVNFFNNVTVFFATVFNTKKNEQATREKRPRTANWKRGKNRVSPVNLCTGKSATTNGFEAGYEEPCCSKSLCPSSGINEPIDHVDNNIRNMPPIGESTKPAPKKLVVEISFSRKKTTKKLKFDPSQPQDHLESINPSPLVSPDVLEISDYKDLPSSARPQTETESFDVSDKRMKEKVNGNPTALGETDNAPNGAVQQDLTDLCEALKLSEGFGYDTVNDDSDPAGSKNNGSVYDNSKHENETKMSKADVNELLDVLRSSEGYGYQVKPKSPAPQTANQTAPQTALETDSTCDKKHGEKISESEMSSLFEVLRLSQGYGYDIVDTESATDVDNAMTDIKHASQPKCNGSSHDEPFDFSGLRDVLALANGFQNERGTLKCIENKCDHCKSVGTDSNITIDKCANVADVADEPEQPKVKHVQADAQSTRDTLTEVVQPEDVHSASLNDVNNQSTFSEANAILGTASYNNKAVRSERSTIHKKILGQSESAKLQNDSCIDFPSQAEMPLGKEYLGIMSTSLNEGTPSEMGEMAVPSVTNSLEPNDYKEQNALSIPVGSAHSLEATKSYESTPNTNNASYESMDGGSQLTSEPSETFELPLADENIEDAAKQVVVNVLKNAFFDVSNMLLDGQDTTTKDQFDNEFSCIAEVNSTTDLVLDDFKF